MKIRRIFITPFFLKKMLTINFSIWYKNTNFSPNERNPFVRCYLDARFDRDPVDVHLDKGLHDVKVSGILKDGHEITGSTALCFNSIAWRKNETGAQCMLDTGTAHATFADIQREIKRNGKYVHVLPMLMHTADNLQKAEIEISIDSLNCDFKPEPLGSQMAINASITQYINSTLQIEQSMEETFGPQTANMRIPYDYSESGIQSTNGVPLPAVAYVLSETPKTNDHYWENAFTTVMARDDLKPEDWERLNMTGKARATINMISYIAQYMDYIGDTVDKNQKGKRYDPNLIQPYENFGETLGLIGGGKNVLFLKIFNLTFNQIAKTMLQELCKVTMHLFFIILKNQVLCIRYLLKDNL